MGIRPNTATTVAQAFLESLAFYQSREGGEKTDESQPVGHSRPAEVVIEDARNTSGQANSNIAVANNAMQAPESNINGEDRILIRLKGGRRAWLVLPSELYVEDKARIKAQLDIVVADYE